MKKTTKKHVTNNSKLQILLRVVAYIAVPVMLLTLAACGEGGDTTSVVDMSGVAEPSSSVTSVVSSEESAVSDISMPSSEEESSEAPVDDSSEESSAEEESSKVLIEESSEESIDEPAEPEESSKEESSDAEESSEESGEEEEDDRRYEDFPDNDEPYHDPGDPWGYLYFYKGHVQIYGGGNYLSVGGRSYDVIVTSDKDTDIKYEIYANDDRKLFGVRVTATPDIEKLTIKYLFAYPSECSEAYIDVVTINGNEVGIIFDNKGRYIDPVSQADRLVGCHEKIAELAAMESTKAVAPAVYAALDKCDRVTCCLDTWPVYFMNIAIHHLIGKDGVERVILTDYGKTTELPLHDVETELPLYMDALERAEDGIFDACRRLDTDELAKLFYEKRYLYDFNTPLEAFEAYMEMDEPPLNIMLMRDVNKYGDVEYQRTIDCLHPEKGAFTVVKYVVNVGNSQYNMRVLYTGDGNGDLTVYNCHVCHRYDNNPDTDGLHVYDLQ